MVTTILTRCARWFLYADKVNLQTTIKDSKLPTTTKGQEQKGPTSLISLDDKATRSEKEGSTEQGSYGTKKTWEAEKRRLRGLHQLLEVPITSALSEGTKGDLLRVTTIFIEFQLLNMSKSKVGSDPYIFINHFPPEDHKFW